MRIKDFDEKERFILIALLSELRDNYSIFDANEAKYYHALSAAICAINEAESES